MKISDSLIEERLKAELSVRKTVAPRDIALLLVEESGAADLDWRSLLPRIRATAVQMESAQTLAFWRKGKIVPSEGLRGVYRFTNPEESAPVDKTGAEEPVT